MQTKKMNPEVKALWLADLRSGQHQQAEAVLCRAVEDENDTDAPVVKGWCCLGRLEDIKVKLEGKAWSFDAYEERMVSPFRNEADIEAGDTILTEAVREWAGLDSLNPSFTDDEGFQRTLSGMNDCGSTFEQLADVIEKYF